MAAGSWMTRVSEEREHSVGVPAVCGTGQAGELPGGGELSVATSVSLPMLAVLPEAGPGRAAEGSAEDVRFDKPEIALDRSALCTPGVPRCSWSADALRHDTGFATAEARS